jgi:serine/threonine protein kinase
MVRCPKCGNSNYNQHRVCLECSYFINQLSPGTLLINRYEIIRIIKTGGMGAIYLGFDIYSDCHCAVKQMFLYEEDPLINKYITGRFLSEAKLLLELDHPSIPKVMDYFNQESHNYYMVMDYIEGQDLFSWALKYTEETGRDIPEELVVKWAIELCDVFIYLHSRLTPVIHRDLNPTNIILRDKDEKIILVDFGFARPVSPGATMTAGIGTDTYSSPEQQKGFPDHRSDLYSLGATMHFLLTLEESKAYSFCPVREIRLDVSEKTERVIEKSLNFLPKDRFSSAEEMKEALLK